MVGVYRVGVSLQELSIVSPSEYDGFIRHDRCRDSTGTKRQLTMHAPGPSGQTVHYERRLMMTVKLADPAQSLKYIAWERVQSIQTSQEDDVPVIHVKLYTHDVPLVVSQMNVGVATLKCENNEWSYVDFHVYGGWNPAEAIEEHANLM